MPPNRNSSTSPPPKVMTWGKVWWVLVLAGVFDLLRYFFLLFWFFGPAFVALYCINKVGNVVIVGSLLAKGCVVGAAMVGAGGFAIAIAFGTVMGVSAGFLGWLVVVFSIGATDSRTFGENPSSLLWVGEGLGASVFIMAFGVYRKQIKKERAEYAKWEKETAAARQEEQNQQMIRIAQIRQAQEQEEEQFAEQVEAANDEQYEQEEKKKEVGAQQSAPQTALTEETQFETLKDALSELNAKKNRTPEENRKLVRARWIMLNISIDPIEMNDPVLRAAYERASRGQKVSNATDGNQNGFVFNNLRDNIQSVPKPAAGPAPATVNNQPHGRPKSPEEERRAA